MTSDRTLNSGAKIPEIGLGVWLVKNEKECKTAVSEALANGYRHIDTAQIYGNEEFVGAAINSSNVPREDIFLTTKIWNDNFWWDDLIPSFEESLAKLQSDYVDLLLLHFPVTETRGAAWSKMEELYKTGRAKSIGVSNYTVRHLEELLGSCEIVPAVNQVELHVYLQQPELLEYCRKHNIVVEAYSPLAHGYGLDNAVLVKLAKKHNKSPAQIMIRWCLEAGAVTLPKSIHAGRIKENIDVFDFKLDASDLAEIKNLNKGLHTSWDPTNVP